jgi:hypothetical protein
MKQVRHDVARILTVLRERSTEEELERAVTRADVEALAESREAQARGEKKGTALGEMAQAASIEEEAAMGAEYVPDEEEQ